MKKFFNFLILILQAIPVQKVFPQEFKSIIQMEYEQHKYMKHEKSLFKDDGSDIIPLQKAKRDLNRIVYGYLPDWEYSTAKYNLNYDLLSHISAFDFVVSSTGSMTNPSGWPWNDVINAAHAKGVKVILTAVCFNAADIHSILTNVNNKQNLISNIISKIQTYKLDGVNVDFEGMSSSDRGSLLNSFMQELTLNIHTQLPGKEVSFAGPAVNWSSSWDLPGLAMSCDYIFIMGYDFYGSWGTSTGPSSPLTGGSINISNTVNSQYSSITSLMPYKLVLGVPYYGNKWKTNDSLAYSTVPTSNYVSSTRFKDDYVNSQYYGLLWDSKSQTPWYRYKLNGQWYQVWFDNDSSLGLKYQLAQSKNYKGVGMWALGYDGTRQELWNELKKRFYTQSKVENLENIPNTVILHQNYPNPFNPSTLIRYKLRANAYVSLKIYDLMGREIKTIFSEYKNAGNHEASCSMEGLPSGIYYYRLAASDFIDTKKMIVLK